MKAVQRVLVIDRHQCAGGNGLSIQSDASVVCWRHNSVQHRAKGIWEVVFTPSRALREFSQGGRALMRPAVVDDFGNLAFVGEPQ